MRRQVGPGLLESGLSEWFCFDLTEAGVGQARQISLPVFHNGIRLDCGLMNFNSVVRNDGLHRLVR
jgi:hypothetical protein